jgi:limonene-1,2-epoxide hydrolase
MIAIMARPLSGRIGCRATGSLALPMTLDPESTVRTYLDRLVDHDWAAVTECLHPEVVRIGPFVDTYTPRDRYVQFLSSFMPTLVNYHMDIERFVSRDSVVLVQLSEFMEIAGSEDVTHEVLVFDTDATGLITRIEIFIQRPPA